MQQTSEWGREAQDKATDHGEQGPLAPFACPVFWEDPHLATCTLEPIPHLPCIKSIPRGKHLQDALRDSFTIRSREEKTKSQPPKSLHKPALRRRQECAGHTQTEHLWRQKQERLIFTSLNTDVLWLICFLLFPQWKLKKKPKNPCLHEGHPCNWANTESYLLAPHFAGDRAQLEF